MKLLVGITVLTLGILSVVPAIRATEPQEVDPNGKTLSEAFTPAVGAPISVPFQTTENFSLGAVTESSADADKLAKQLNDPVAALISADSPRYGPD